jgi:hypothetical protein
MNLSKQIDKSFKVNKNPTNLSEIDPEITKNKTVPKRFPILKIFSRNIFKKKSKETEQIEFFFQLHLTLLCGSVIHYLTLAMVEVLKNVLQHQLRVIHNYFLRLLKSFFL